MIYLIGNFLFTFLPFVDYFYSILSILLTAPCQYCSLEKTALLQIWKTYRSSLGLAHLLGDIFPTFFMCTITILWFIFQ